MWPLYQITPRMFNLLSQTSEINIQFIFAVSDQGKIVADTLLRLPDEIVEDAMHTWFVKNTRDADQWSKYWISEAGLDQKDFELLSVHEVWCELESISVTPTLFFNGYELPVFYKLKDLPDLIRVSSTFEEIT